MRNLIVTAIALAVTIALCSCGKERIGEQGPAGPAGPSGASGGTSTGHQVEILRVPATGYLSTTCLQVGSLSYYVRKSTAGSSNLDLYATASNCSSQTARIDRLNTTDNEAYEPSEHTKISIIDGTVNTDVAAILWEVR